MRQLLQIGKTGNESKYGSVYVTREGFGRLDK